jgi:magnesium-transporting ATPase (P-type)
MASSTIVRDCDSGEVLVFVKGADSSMFRMSNGNYTNYSKMREECDRFAAKGLRILVLGYKSLGKVTDDEIKWQEMKPKDVEHGVTLIAVTAVEDMLQEKVNESIQDFKAAGMKVWMLTGDKGETARMIGIHCGLIP